VMGEVALMCVVIIVGSGVVFVGRPMKQLMAKLRKIGAGDLDDPLLLSQRDEMGQLAREINDMCRQLDQARVRVAAETSSRIAAVEQMRHAERLSMVGRLASGVAHELGTPLNVALAHAALIARRQSEGDAAVADAQTIADQCQRMAGIIRQLLDLARPHPINKQAQDVRAVVSGALGVIEPVATKHRVMLNVESAALPIVADIDADQIRQVLNNLVMNAIQAQPDGGAVRVLVEKVSAAELRIRIDDSGSGIQPDALERVFEPFFTTKDPGEGTGLGLTVSYGIVRDHGGRIEVESELGKGSAFTVYLPLGASPG